MPLTYTGPAESEAAPLFEQYPNQFKPQPAFLELDPAKGTVRLGTNLVMGNGVPMDVWLHRVLWWDVPANLTGRGCYEIFGEMKPLLERVAAGHSIEWDGQNMVGRLTDDAREAHEEIERHLHHSAQGFEAAEIWDVQSWLYGDQTTLSLAIALGIGADTSDEELAAVVESQREEARRQEIVLIGDLAKVLRDVRGQLRELASDEAPAP